MKKEDTWKSIFQYSIGAFIVLAFVFLVMVLALQNKPIQESPILLTLVGSLGTMTGGILNYMFSSTKSSAEKNEMIYNSTPKNESRS